MEKFAAAPVPLPAPTGGTSRVQLLPLGTLKPVDGRGPWQVDDPAAIIAASLPRVQRGMPVDLDHAIDRKQNAPAAGWIKSLSHDGAGIWAEIEWTPMGKARLDAREYRFISPTFIHGHGGKVLRIDRAALTNDPALEMAALCAKEEAVDDPGKPLDQLPAEFQQFLTALRDALRLPAGAPSSEILSAVRQAISAAPRKDEAPVVEQLASAMFEGWSQRRQSEVADRVSAAVRDGKLPPALESWGMKVCAANGGLFDEFVRDAPNLSYLSTSTLAGTRLPEKGKPHEPGGVFAQLGLA